MVDTAAEHYQANSLAALQPLMRVEIGDDSPRDIARYLHERMVAPLSIFYSNQGVLIVLAGGIAESSAELPFDVPQRCYFARN